MAFRIEATRPTADPADPVLPSPESTANRVLGLALGLVLLGLSLMLALAVWANFHQARAAFREALAGILKRCADQAGEMDNP